MPQGTGHSRQLGAGTRAVHAGETPDPRTGSVTVPLHLTSTYWYPELPPRLGPDGRPQGGGPSPYIYSRYANPTVEAAEAKLASLEGAAGSMLFSSGMASTTAACLAFLKPGDVVAVQAGVYGGTTALLKDELARFGVKPQTVGAQAPGTRGRAKEAGQGAPPLPRGTRLVWMESVTNPLLRVADVRAWADAAHDAGALLAVDASFCSPALQRPLDLGADLAMHSATKYLGGHSDLLAGALSWKDPALRDGLFRVRRNLGPTLDPHAAFLLARGMKTLMLRMERHCSNALALAKACAEDAAVAAVHYPGLPGHPDHAVARRTLQGGFGGVVTIDLGTKERAVAFRRALRLVTPAASLGGAESLASLPLETSHSYSSAAQRRAEGIGDGLVRISTGIEDAEDILADVLGAARTARP